MYVTIHSSSSVYLPFYALSRVFLNIHCQIRFFVFQALLSNGKESHGHSHDSHGHSHDDEGMSQHDDFVWKMMIAVLGLYAFFLTERLTIIGQNSATMRKMKRNEVSYFSLIHQFPPSFI